MGFKVQPKHDGTKTLTQLQKYQEGNRKRTGRKRPKELDYKDLPEEFIAPARGPWKYRKVAVLAVNTRELVTVLGEPTTGEPDLVETAPGEPAPGEPGPGEPAPGEPAPGEPAPGEPGPREPATVELVPIGKEKCNNCGAIVSKKA